MGLPDVSHIWWRERSLLEQLLFKLTEEQMLLAAGHVRWLSAATDEVEVVLEDIAHAELVRAIEVQAAGRELGVGPNPSLRDLAEAALPPWGAILMEHRDAFLKVTEEITELAKANRQLILRGYAAEDRAAIASQIDSLRTNLLELANTTYMNRPLFAGTSPTAKAYDSSANYLGTNPGSPGDQVMRTVAPNVTVRVNLTGPEVFGAPGSDIFSVLSTVANDLRTNPANLSNDIGALDGATTTMKNAQATIGARYHEIDTMRSRNDALKLTTTTALSQLEDVDLPATVSKLQMQEVAYQAALAATSKTVGPSLVDFLK